MKYISWSLLFPNFFLARCLVTAESAWAEMSSSYLVLGWWSRYNCCEPFSLVEGHSAAGSLWVFPLPSSLQGKMDMERPLFFWKACCALVFWILLNADQLWAYSSIMIISHIRLLTSPFLPFLQAQNLINSALEASARALLAYLCTGLDLMCSIPNKIQPYMASHNNLLFLLMCMLWYHEPLDVFLYFLLDFVLWETVLLFRARRVGLKRKAYTAH